MSDTLEILNINNRINEYRMNEGDDNTVELGMKGNHVVPWPIKSALLLMNFHGTSHLLTFLMNINHIPNEKT